MKYFFFSFFLLTLSVLYDVFFWLGFRNDLQEAADVISAGRVEEAEAEELFDRVDADKSGVIEYGEFKQVLNAIPATPGSVLRPTTKFGH